MASDFGDLVQYLVPSGDVAVGTFGQLYHDFSGASVAEAQAAQMQAAAMQAQAEASAAAAQSQATASTSSTALYLIGGGLLLFLLMSKK